MRYGGVDEAGRGPIIGPMVIALVIGDSGYLKELGVKDSKLLTKEQREELFNEIVKNSLVKYEIVSPSLIDRYNLNELEAKVTANLINSIEDEISHIVIDSPERPENYKLRILKYLKKRVKIITKNKGEEDPLVAAASIVAKVIRDREIEKIKEQTGIDFGSGYPSDKRTRKALEQYYRILKPYIRKKWPFEINKKLTDFI
ncbi:NEQ063 [Nanoarchaeum equitans Kin4-M]|uniref:Ribonuclease HII n=1 Tax=Nanoarchaeum equitans (strain Kin4-M) TaxID=228908 RepID=RNH2_NANEQ|nr:RecName: Full=Ribonuclease HII; Short=RNase HII [Nanoarchaeum equitans Kin4-M]AAR38918.1 NEQ063 [Nanoarchaeum equitans Kin4-M]